MVYIQLTILSIQEFQGIKHLDGLCKLTKKGKEKKKKYFFCIKILKFNVIYAIRGVLDPIQRVEDHCFLIFQG